MSNLNVKSCSMCGKIFKPRGYPFCPDCMEKIDDDYIAVRDYLYKEPRAGIQEILENTDVQEKRLLYLVRSGRVSFAEGVDSGVKCESCGKPIPGGTICKSCQSKISGTLSGAAAGIAPKPKTDPGASKKSGVRMHIDDRVNKRD